MNGLATLWAEADAVGRVVALLLLAMSVAAWVLIFWKGSMLRRARHDVASGIAAFWGAASIAAGRERLAAIDREGLLRPLVEAVAAPPGEGSLAAGGRLGSQPTRRLRDALHAGLAHLQRGQVVLASIGSTAPFVGLFGTVWGVYRALVGIGGGGGFSLEQVSGPIGEALVMTAAGIAVAVPAVLGFNVHGQRIAALEAELEGFAHDLREAALDAADPSRPLGEAGAGTGG
jgi:biopolymer transport protein ExbB